MKILSLTLLFVFLFGPSNGQPPPIGIIDFYGLRSTTEQQAREALQIKEGDAMPDSTQDAQRRLEALPNVLQAHLNVACCEAGKLILYVGLREKGVPSLRFRSAPKGAARLPEAIVQAGKAYMDALTDAVQSGNTSEDDLQGHALSPNPKARAIQDMYIAFAAGNLKLLRDVLRESSDAQHRALAAQIIAYTADKRDVVKDLVRGMHDADGNVRNNSIRALAIIAALAARSPRLGIKVPVLPFIEMLNSIEWTDRNKSSIALARLTDKRDPAILSLLRTRTLQSLVEMSRWKSPGHAFSPFFLLGRVGNLSDDEIQKAWDSGNRETMIETVLRKVKSN